MYDNLPPSLKPFYKISEPNQPISICETLLLVCKGDSCMEGLGEIYLEWLPKPQIKFKLRLEDCSLVFVEHCVLLKIPEFNLSVDALIAINQHFNNISGRSKIEIIGRIRNSISIGCQNSFSYITFHIANFYDFFGSCPAVDKTEKISINQRGILENDEWKVTIDQLKSTTESIKYLESKGGFQITHVGKIEKISREEFSVEDSQDILEMIGIFLSFIRGLKIAPLLPVGFDESSEVVWQDWGFYNINPWSMGPYSWAIDHSGTVKAIDFETIFSGFSDFWKKHRDSVRALIHWYTASNISAAGAEGSIILQQTALELISTLYLVEERKVFENHCFEKMQASRKINRLLEHTNVPQSIPASLSNLTTYSESIENKEQRYNGPRTVVNVRNNIVHSSRENRQSFASLPAATIIETKRLSLHYLERVLLYIFNYEGRYIDRFNLEE